MPVIVMLLAIWFGLLYNNKRLDDFSKRLDDFRDLLRAEVRAEILASEKRILAEMAEMKAELKADIAALDRRVQRLEAPLLRT